MRKRRKCPDCGKLLKPLGFGPHRSRMHGKRANGDPVLATADTASTLYRPADEASTPNGDGLGVLSWPTKPVKVQINPTTYRAIVLFATENGLLFTPFDEVLTRIIGFQKGGFRASR